MWSGNRSGGSRRVNIRTSRKYLLKVPLGTWARTSSVPKRLCTFRLLWKKVFGDRRVDIEIAMRHKIKPVNYLAAVMERTCTEPLNDEQIFPRLPRKLIRSFRSYRIPKCTTPTVDSRSYGRNEARILPRAY